MTQNTIRYKEYEEGKRSNLAKESLTRQELAIKAKEAQIKADTLAETIENNLRNYGINVEKNAIQRLANDQLNNREAQKIAETIRSNLKSEEIRLKELKEKERNNKARERIDLELNDIKRMDTLLSAAKATGKTPVALLLSWFTNQANLQAFAGTNNFNEYAQQVKSWLEQGDEALNKNTRSPYTKPVLSAQREASQARTANPASTFRYTYERNAKRGDKKSIQDYKNAYLTEAAFNQWNEKGPGDIPTDKSNSSGPGGSNYEKSSKQAKTNVEVRVGQPPISEKYSSSPGNNNSESTTNRNSGSAIIDTRSKVGPGFS